ncbi:MAG: hypothetical protein ACRDXE_04885 [Acidimicrobiales bacterium]
MTRNLALIGAVVIGVVLIAANFGATALGFSHGERQQWGFVDGFWLTGTAILIAATWHRRP